MQGRRRNSGVKFLPVCVTRDTEKVGNGKIRRLAILELGGATEQAIAHSTLSRAWSEAGTEGAEVRDMPCTRARPILL
jgi:hypothetical protein